jgi:hypothetical protein
MPSALVFQMIYGRVNALLRVFFLGSVFIDVKSSKLIVTQLLEDTQFRSMLQTEITK